MKDRIRRQWEALGESDPYWAVLSDPRRKDSGWDREEFFRSGKREIEGMLGNLDRKGVSWRPGTALDFGCGVGRLSRALSRHFDHVIGVDISESMLKEARAVNQDIGNIRFVHNTANGIPDLSDGSIDLVYSNIVLQHMPSTRQATFVRELCRVLRVDGIMVVHTPAGPDYRTLKGWAHVIAGNRLLNVLRRLRHGKHGVMEIHTFERERMLELLAANGLDILDAEPCDATGKGFIGYRYCAIKRAGATPGPPKNAKQHVPSPKGRRTG